MLMQLTMTSLSGSACSRYGYLDRRHHHHRHRCHTRIAAQSSVATEIFSHGRKFVFSNSKPEVVNDGMDCLPNPKTPWLKLCPELDTKEGVIMDAFYSVAENRVVRLSRRDCLGVPATAKCFASTGEWLGFINPMDDLLIYLANPFFSDKDMGVIRLPSLSTISSCIGVERDLETGCVDYFNMVDRSVQEMSTIKPELVTNLAISHSDPCHVDCVVTALLGENISRLAYSRIWDDHDSNTSLRWIGLQEDSPPKNTDNQVVFSHTHKLFYTVNGNGIEVFDLSDRKEGSSKRVCVFSNDDIEKELRNEFEQEQNKELKNLRESSLTRGSELINDHYFKRTYHLVMLDDHGLLLIVRHLVKNANFVHDRTLHFDVFKVIFNRRRLVRLKTLGDYCLFVGANNSFSLCASNVPGLHPNSIYYITPYLTQQVCDFTALMDRGIFKLDNCEIQVIFVPYSPVAPFHQDVFDKTMWLGCERVFWISPSNIIA